MTETKNTINWYPGHMTRAKRQLAEQIKNVDVVVELCDARLPRSSRNPDLKKIIAARPSILVLGKTDLADPRETEKWLQHYRQEERLCVALNLNKGVRPVSLALEKAAYETVQRAQQRGIKKTVRVMVVGVPNVGKSTLINRMRGNSIVKTADRPGVTRSSHWIKIGTYLEMLDTPGLLWPRLDDHRAAERLAYIAAIREEVLHTEELAVSLLTDLMHTAPQETIQRFKISNADAGGEELLYEVCRGRGFLLRGGTCDTERASHVVLDEFRSGKVGAITLEPFAESVKESFGQEERIP